MAAQPITIELRARAIELNCIAFFDVLYNQKKVGIKSDLYRQIDVK